jgi:hypothetical protein
MSELRTSEELTKRAPGRPRKLTPTEERQLRRLVKFRRKVAACLSNEALSERFGIRPSLVKYLANETLDYRLHAKYQRAGLTAQQIQEASR